MRVEVRAYSHVDHQPQRENALKEKRKPHYFEAAETERKYKLQRNWLEVSRNAGSSDASASTLPSDDCVGLGSQLRDLAAGAMVVYKVKKGHWGVGLPPSTPPPAASGYS